MKEIILIFVTLIVLFSVIGFTPLCEGCDIFKVELKTGLADNNRHISWEKNGHDKKHENGESCENCGGECENCSGECENECTEDECDENEHIGNCQENNLSTLHCREKERGVCGDNMNAKDMEGKLVTIAQIREEAASFDSKQVYMVVSEGIRPGDSDKGLEQLSTRSDCYVHDDTGTMVLRNGWQYKNAYMQGLKSKKGFVFIDENIKIEKGIWYINPFVYSRYSKTILSLRKFD